MTTSPDNQPAILIASTDAGLPAELPHGLAKYTGFREMARGGNALLRSCFDTLSGRSVAVKTLLPQFRENARDNRRFLREARVTAQLQHPNTVPVYEVGRDEQEGLYFTMRRISGENFFEVLKRIARRDARTVEDFPIARRVEIISDACQALAYAHARGVVHRDVKPENIWVGNFGEVVLLDWGAAKVWGQPDELVEAPPAVEPAPEPDDQPEPPQTLTLADQRPGTPLYMSPEQVGGQGTIDERTDVFSTGVVLYEMLTLSEPFRGRTIAGTFDNILNRTPPPPSERSPQAGIPAALDAVVMRAIAKRPADRYQTMPSLIADLRATPS
ncbi:MAG: serine/threonine-protein kinase [Planctomycetota bacterium]